MDYLLTELKKRALDVAYLDSTECRMGLVDYTSDSESDESIVQSVPQSNKSRLKVTPQESGNRPIKRRRVLPAIPSSYTIDPKDDPSLHQGRTRSRPFVPGELNAHVYLNLRISRKLRLELESLIEETQKRLTDQVIHSSLSTPTPSQTAGELHVSLTHPLPLRISQIEDFRTELSRRIREWSTHTGTSGIRTSLPGRVSVYYNGRATGGEGTGGRAFMALRLAAGSSEVGSIVEKAIHPLLDKYHLPLYHENPEYHASFAWCLLKPDKDGASTDVDAGKDEPVEGNLSRREESPFTTELIRELDRGFEQKILAAHPKGGWDISHITFRVGKSIHEIPLS